MVKQLHQTTRPLPLIEGCGGLGWWYQRWNWSQAASHSPLKGSLPLPQPASHIAYLLTYDRGCWATSREEQNEEVKLGLVKCLGILAGPGGRHPGPRADPLCRGQ